MDTLLIVGCGLIGSSIARGARARGLAQRIAVLDPSEDTVARALRLGVADIAATDAQALGVEAPMAAIATPPAVIGQAVEASLPALSAHAAVFDTASVKGAAVEAMRPFAGRLGVVPAHPIAGSERSGVEAGREDLFAGRWCALTPDARLQAPREAIERVAGFWRGLGALVDEMAPEEHDALLAATSHAPHLIAYALTSTAADESGAVRSDMVRFSAGGFRDFTRIAASDPLMWRDVFLLNRDAALAAVDRFQDALEELKAVVAAGDGAELERRFAGTRSVRGAIVEAGQETAAEDFGRRGDED